MKHRGNKVAKTWANFHWERTDHPESLHVNWRMTLVGWPTFNADLRIAYCDLDNVRNSAFRLKAAKRMLRLAAKA